MSELIAVSTPCWCMIAALCGIDSYASSLYCHQSEKVEPAAPCSAISVATRYPSMTCVNTSIRNPNRSATRMSMRISSARYECA